MTEPAPMQVRDALDELVNQFSDPMSFLRELIQNSIDAGSEEIEVWVDREGEGDAGVTVIRIEDWGEGMTREIIERRLTRLFSSAKDGDKTKIGKFGIGFVSVFAIEPEAVCVDTSREGETWRVLFDKARRFKLIRVDEPVDGTKVRVLKKTDAEEHAELVERAADVLRYWCKHVATDIRFQGEPIRLPFSLPDAIASVEHDDGFSHILVGHAPGTDSFAGFYNAGLTLIETVDPELPGFDYKVSSPHLEHTLTRDNVIHDAGYERVMKQVREMIATQLRDAVLQELRRGLSGEAQVNLDALVRALARHAALGHLEDTGRAPVARAPSGKLVSWSTLRGGHREDSLLLTRHRSHLTDALEAGGHTVILEDAPLTFMRELLPIALRSDVGVARVDERWCLAAPPAVAPPEGLQRLAAAVRKLLSDDGAKVGDVDFGSFDYPGSKIADRVAIATKRVDEPTPVAEAVELARGFLSRSRALVLNVAHPIVDSLARLANREPEFAAYLTVKHFSLGHTLDAALDTRLLQHGLNARWQRSTT